MLFHHIYYIISKFIKLRWPTILTLASKFDGLFVGKLNKKTYISRNHCKLYYYVFDVNILVETKHFMSLDI